MLCLSPIFKMRVFISMCPEGISEISFLSSLHTAYQFICHKVLNGLSVGQQEMGVMEWVKDHRLPGRCSSLTEMETILIKVKMWCGDNLLGPPSDYSDH